MQGELDFTQYFTDEESKERHKLILKDRPLTLGFTPQEDFAEKIQKLRDEMT